MYLVADFGLYVTGVQNKTPRIMSDLIKSCNHVKRALRNTITNKCIQQSFDEIKETVTTRVSDHFAWQSCAGLEKKICFSNSLNYCNYIFYYCKKNISEISIKNSLKTFRIQILNSLDLPMGHFTIIMVLLWCHCH